MNELQVGDWYEDNEGDVCEKGVDEDGWLANIPNTDSCAGPFAVIASHNGTMEELRKLRSDNERLRKVGSEMVNAIEQWADGTAGWSTRLRAAQEAARPVLGMGQCTIMHGSIVVVEDDTLTPSEYRMVAGTGPEGKR